MIPIGVLVAIFGPRFMGGLAYVCAIGCFAVALVDPLEGRRQRRYQRCRDRRRMCPARQQSLGPRAGGALAHESNGGSHEILERGGYGSAPTKVDPSALAQPPAGAAPGAPPHPLRGMHYTGADRHVRRQ